MKISILIPHYKVGKITAYSISKILEHKGSHEVNVIVIDNNPGDGSSDYFKPFKDSIVYIPYPKDKLQSHGIAFNYALDNGYVDTDYFITLENDSFPTIDGYLDYYEKIINAGMDAAGSILELSGGCYMHPCGALYKTSVYFEAKKYYESLEYLYFPNMIHSENFDCHAMIHKSIADSVLENPEDFFDLSKSYYPYSKESALERMEYYKPTNGVFHNGMGMIQESVLSYGKRTFELDVPSIILNNKQKIIKRVGYEPGQSFSYWMDAVGKKYHNIPTEIKWMPNRIGQQQEYTLNEAGIKHLWAISSYVERGSENVEDIYEAKRRLPDELYETLPDSQKVKL